MFYINKLDWYHLTLRAKLGLGAPGQSSFPSASGEVFVVKGLSHWPNDDSNP